MNAFITYDVSNNGQKEVKDGMKKIGYHDRWLKDNITYYLPETSLWKKDTELAQALKDIKAVISKANESRPANDKIRLVRCIVVSAHPSDGIPGEPHS